MLQSAHVLFNLWQNSTLFCILTLFISKLPKHAHFSVWFYRSFRYNLAELGSSCLKTFWLQVLAQCTWSHKNNDLGCSQEAGGLRAGAQPVHAISLLLAKLVRHSAPYPFVSWKCEGLSLFRGQLLIIKLWWYIIKLVLGKYWFFSQGFMLFHSILCLLSFLLFYILVRE